MEGSFFLELPSQMPWSVRHRAGLAGPGPVRPTKLTPVAGCSEVAGSQPQPWLAWERPVIPWKASLQLKKAHNARYQAHDVLYHHFNPRNSGYMISFRVQGRGIVSTFNWCVDKY